MSKQKMFLNLMDYWNPEFPINFFVGGRGNGKTYSCMESTIGKNNVHNVTGKFMLWRRTPTEWENMCSANPYKELNTKYDTHYQSAPITKTIGGLYDSILDEKTGKWNPYGEPIGYTAPMLSISKVRSMDFSDVNYIFYDEFIPEISARKQKGEAQAFLNAYETIARNREFLGKPPVYLFAMSNSENIANPLFEYLGIVHDAEILMAKGGEQHKYYRERAMALHILESSEEFKEQKSQTTLYKMAAGTDFVDMAINNEFVANDFSFVAYKSIRGYQPWVAIGDIYVWHKPQTKELYVTYTPARCKVYNIKNSIDRDCFKKEVRLYSEGRLIRGLMYFESYDLKERFLNICKLFMDGK